MTKHLSLLVLALTLAAAPLWAAEKTGAIRPAELRCEYRADPMGIDTPQPRFTWIVVGEGQARGLAQTAYQLVVSDSMQAIQKNKGTLWDSGRVKSDNTVLVSYAGKPLASRTMCYWKLRVWDQDGRPSAWTEPAMFSMGLLKAEDWSADWIGYDAPDPGGQEPREPLLGAMWVWHPEGDPAKDAPAGKRWFRKVVELNEVSGIREATLYVTCDNKARVSINGKRVAKGKDEVQDHRQLYEFSVADLLKPGRNVLAVTAENKTGAAGLIARLEVVFANGNVAAAVTNDAWKVADKEPDSKWSNEDFDDSGWANAREVAEYGAEPWGKAVCKHTYLPPAPYLRHAFAVTKKVRRATAYVSALGLYELRLNGRRVGDYLFTPGWTDYKKRVYYNSYDVTGLLRAGEPNAAGIILADGWYAGHVGNYGPAYYGQNPRCMAQIEIEYEDGKTDRIVTGGTWKAGYGELREADLLMGESHDLTKSIPGWDAPGFNDNGWAPVALTPRAEVKIPVQAYPGEPVRRFETIIARKMAEPKPGVFVYDLGQNIVGWAKIALDGKAGQKVVVRHAEMLQQDGTLYTIALRSARATDYYTLAQDGTVTLEPGFTFHGFRYIEITGVDTAPATDGVRGVVMHSNIPRTAEFEASNPLLTKLAENIVWGQKGNYFEAPTDCPQRDERLGWTGDAQFFMPTALYTADIGAFHTKWLVDLVQDAQLDDGSFAHVAPNVNQGGGAVAWGDAAIICPYLMYRFYGDTRVLEQHFDHMVKGMDFLEATSKDYIRDKLGFGDWLNLGGGAKDEVICTAYYAYLAGLMSEMAGVIGRTAEQAKYADLHTKVRDAFIKNFVGPDGKILESSQTGYALAFAFDLIPEELKKAAADRFVEEIKRFNGHLATGFIGTPRLLPALTLAGREDVAYSLLMNTTFPSWLYQVTLGATTMWERWNGWTPEKGFADPGMNSFNHYAFGAVGEYLYDHVAGIMPDGIGFKKIILRPRPGGGLASAKLSYRSIHGGILSDWKIENGKFMYNVEVPANTTATVCLPSAALETARADGAPLSQASGITAARLENGEVKCQVGSGRYTFEIAYTPPAAGK
jgi:alpha-L-rhamnosidase